MNYLKYAPPLFFKHHLTELVWFVTDRCNLNCKHCFVSTRHSISQNSFIGTDQLVKIGKHLPALQRVCLSGGEPFIRKDISDIVAAIAQNWDYGVINIPTNGLYPEAIINTIRLYGTTTKKSLRIMFSLNAKHKAMDAFTGMPGSFEQWEHSLKKVQSEASAYPNITIAVLTSFSEFNQDSFESLMKYVINDLGVQDFSFGMARAHSAYQPHIDLEKFTRLSRAHYGNKSSINLLNTCALLFREAQVAHRKTNRFMVPCVSGKMRVVLAPDGELYPCETLGYPCGIHREQWSLGNIKQAGFDIPALLRTKKAKDMQNRICSSDCHCDHGCDNSLSMLCSNKFKLRLFGRLVRDTANIILHKITNCNEDKLLSINKPT